MDFFHHHDKKKTEEHPYVDESTQTDKEKKENFLDKLVHHGERADEEEVDDSKIDASRTHPAAVEEEPSFLDRITGKAAREEAERQRLDEECKRREEEQARRNNPLLHLKDKFSEMTGSVGSDAKTEEAEYKPSLFDKITGKAEGEERRRREEAERRKNPWVNIQYKFSEAIGGGQSAEEKEDLLDKAIDEFQEHVLHEGDQKSEGAFEQFKDDRIADIIRSRYKARTGHEFPIRDKK